MEDQGINQDEFYLSYVPGVADSLTFVPNDGFDPYPRVSSAWMPTSTACPGPYYPLAQGAETGYSDMNLLERRGHAVGMLDMSCPDPIHMISQTPTQLVPSPLDTGTWSPLASSSLGGMGGPGSMEYFASTSASPSAPATDWAAGMSIVDTPSRESGKNFSTGDNYSAYSPPVDGGGNMLYPPETMHNVFDLAAHGHADGAYQRLHMAHMMPEGEAAKGWTSDGRVAETSSRSSDNKTKSLSTVSGQQLSVKRGRKRTSVGARVNGPTGTGSPNIDQEYPQQGPKLRTASRRQGSETGQLAKHGESAEDQKARTSHNRVEKEYRNRLNREFELVIDVLPRQSGDSKTKNKKPRSMISKADVIGSATEVLQSLAKEVAELLLR